MVIGDLQLQKFHLRPFGVKQLHFIDSHVKISNHQTAMVSVIGCRAKIQLRLILFFLLSQYSSFGAFALNDITKKRKLNSRKNCTLLADGLL